MVGFNKTKTELSTLQDALAKTQIDLEKTNFELHAKRSMLLSALDCLQFVVKEDSMLPLAATYMQYMRLSLVTPSRHSGHASTCVIVVCKSQAKEAVISHAQSLPV